MKLISKIWIGGIVLLCTCSSPGSNCLQGSGKLTRVEVELPAFTDITVFEHIQLVVEQGDNQRVSIEAGANVISEVTAEVESGMLILKTSPSCQFFREYSPVVVRLTTPELVSLRSSTGWPIQSEGVLAFRQLSLISESFNNSSTQTTDGSFDLQLNTGKVSLVSNGIAEFRLSGNTQELSITLAAGDSRVSAAKLRAHTVRVDHRGSNDIEVFPVSQISGRIRGYGNVICYNRPNAIEVAEEYKGRLIFADDL